MDDRTTITVPETTAQTPMGLAVLPERHRLAISPLNRRRWLNFKANRRGYVAFWIFMVLFVISLFAEFIANDKPFYVSFEGRSYFPAVITYPETAFGGDFETAADYRDPYLQKLIAEKGGFMLWLFVQHAQSRFAHTRALEADLAVDRGAMQSGGRTQGALGLQRPRIQLARDRRPGA